MSPFARVRSVQRILTAGIVVRAVACGVAAGATLFIGAALADWGVGLDLVTRQLLRALAVVAAVAVAVALVWRDRSVRAPQRVALWIEEQDPSLEYRLVTALEAKREALVPAKTADEWTATATSRALRAVAMPVLAMVVALLLPLALPSGAVARVRAPRVGDSIDRVGPGASASRLTPLVAEVAPPAYSGERTATMDEPADVRALVGSTITLRGRGDAAGIVARADSAVVPAVAADARWSITWKVGDRPIALRLSDGRGERIIAVEPIVDDPPSVSLVSPAHDSVLRVPQGRIPLAADLSDDYGIASAAFEYIVSSGEGESFTFKSGTLGAARPGGKHGSINASLSIDSLELKAGDIVHVRAIARDANDVSGPGVGTSETRTLRIARADEYDSVAVEAAAPPDPDRSALSQRMLIQLAEALQKKRSSLARGTFVNESRAIATDQKRLRRDVGEIVFTRLGGDPSGEEHTDDDPPEKAKTMEELLARADSATNFNGGVLDFEGDESPVVAVNKPLLEAYNAMWDASTELELGEPGRALPHMRRALAAIQKARQADRLYLRGQPPAVVLDLAKVRLTGKDKGSSSVRRAFTAGDSAQQRRAERFVRLAELAVENASAAADSLLLMRIDVLPDNAPLAAALGDAAAALRSGRADDATAAFVRGRRALGGAPVARDSIARWGVVP
jgi:hypothetical protein